MDSPTNAGPALQRVPASAAPRADEAPAISDDGLFWAKLQPPPQRPPSQLYHPPVPAQETCTGSGLAVPADDGRAAAVRSNSDSDCAAAVAHGAVESEAGIEQPCAQPSVTSRTEENVDVLSLREELPSGQPSVTPATEEDVPVPPPEGPPTSRGENDGSDRPEAKQRLTRARDWQEQAEKPAVETSLAAESAHAADVRNSRPTNLAVGLIRALDFLADPNGSTYDEIVACLERNKWHDFSNCQTPHASIRSRAYVLISKAREALGDDRVRPLAAYRRAEEATNRLKLGSLTAEQWRTIGIDPPPRWGNVWPGGSREWDGKEVSLSPPRPDHLMDAAAGDVDPHLVTIPGLMPAARATSQDEGPRASKRVKLDHDPMLRRSSRVRENHPSHGSSAAKTPSDCAAPQSAPPPTAAISRKRGRPRKNLADAATEDLACLASRVRENRRPLKRVSYFEGDDGDTAFDDEEWPKTGFGPGWVAEETENAVAPSAAGEHAEQLAHVKCADSQRPQKPHAAEAEETPESQQHQQDCWPSDQSGKPRSYHELMQMAERVIAAPIGGLVPILGVSESGAAADKSVDRHVELYLATRLLEARTRRMEEEARMVEAETKLVQFRMKLAKLRGEPRAD